jgi:antitoxin MazE
MSKTATLTVQQWGNRLAVRIPAAVARSARFTVGQPVEVSAESLNVLVRGVGPRWSDTPNDAGQRRLEDPDDFVRI